MVVHKSHATSLLDLPDDVFVAVFQQSSLHSLYCLLLTCRDLHDLVASIGWAAHQRMREERSLSWAPACLYDEPGWTMLARLRHDALASRNLHTRAFVLHRLAVEHWSGYRRPVLALGPARTRLVVGVGAELHVYRFVACGDGGKAPRVKREGKYTIETPSRDQEKNDSIRSLAFFPENSAGADRTLLAGFESGCIMRLTLPEPAESADADTKVKAEVLYWHRGAVGSVSMSQSFAFSLSGRRGVLSAFSSESILGSSSPEPLFVDLKSQCRASLFLPSSPGGPYLAMGLNKPTPLTLHVLKEGSSMMSTHPTMLLGFPNGELNEKFLSDLGVEVLAPAPPAFPGAHSGAMLVSGWVAGYIRLYDVRVPPAAYYDDGCGPTPVLPPVMTLSQTGDFHIAPNSLTTGGPLGTTIAASTSLGVVAFWDVRSPRAPVVTKNANVHGHMNTQADDFGWSLCKPMGDSSVYALALAGTRCFGVTGRQPFMIDFGGGDTSSGASLSDFA